MADSHKWQVYELADPELIAVYAESQGEKRPTIRTTDAVSLLCSLRSPGFRCVERVHSLHVVTPDTRVLASFWYVHNEKYGSFSTGNRKRVASIASTASHSTSNSHFGRLFCWCGHPDVYSCNFGQKYLVRSYRGNSLVVLVLF